MSTRRLRAAAGFTLLEVTLAVAIFAAVIGVTAQSLMSFYATMDMQEQRVEAINACRSVMSAVRDKRYEVTDDFPGGLITWINENNGTHWASFSNSNPETGALKDFAITVACKDMAGGDAGDGDNPVQIAVNATWSDVRGRPIAVMLGSVITNE
ncbi:MAG: type II secretion system protein [Candidatus Hydrogenedentes bacterium]|nr:type II secretion system protein [Candidatus Hydrogenedentota bacterium]